MRVDFVITELFVGGAEQCLTELAVGLAEAGDQVRVFSLASLPTGPQRRLVERLQSSGVNVGSGGADSIFSTRRAYRRLCRWFSESVPHVSQTFLYHANVLGTFAARAAGVDTRVAGVRVAESNRWRCWQERVALARVESVVCVSKGVQQFARRRLHVPEPRCHVIPNGVNLRRFAEAQPLRWSSLGWPEDSVVTLFVGRLHPQKGLELLQSEIDVIAPPGSKRRLLLVGDGPLRARLQSWAERVGEERVKLVGWQQEIPPLMRAAHVLVLPSHYEGMPNVVLEAMAAARPVVCSRVEGIAELMPPRGAEQSFTPGDHAALGKLVERFLSDPALREQTGCANQQHVQRHFSVSAMVDAYRLHYRELRTRRLDVDR